jgi:iron complex outermembrane receptor protein
MYVKNLLKFTCFILLIFSALGVAAQNITITGKVTDAKDASPLTGVSIAVKGSTSGTLSDINGNFKLSAPSSATVLVLSYVGYIKKEVAITQSPLNITLEASDNSLNEVLVVGYGTVRKKDATGAVVKVTSDKFVQGVTTDPLQQIQGQAPGVVITTISGDPNSDPVVRIRGTASLSGGNDPLYVIDGVAGADIRSVSPNDIESFDILKDASSAAIYGSRAAGGVILVTTKSGKAGKTQVNYNSYVAAESAEHVIDFMNRSQYLSAYQAYYGHAMPTGTSTTSDQGANTNWFDQILQTGFTQNHNLSVSGGTEKGRYLASLSYTDQQGIVKTVDRKDLNGRFNFNQKALDDKLLITINVSASETNADYIGNNTQVFLDAAAVPSVIGVRDPLNPANYQLINNTQEANPVPQLLDITNNGVTDRATGAIRFDYTIVKGLTFSPYANGTKSNTNNLIYYPPSNLVSPFADQYGYTPTLTNDGDVDKTSFAQTDETYGFNLAYKNTFGKSRLSLLGGYEFDSFNYMGQRVGAHNFNDINLPNENIGAANQITIKDIASYDNGYVLKSWLGRAEYSFNDKYYLYGSVRYDHSNKLGPNDQGGVFPSASAAWVISSEDFMKGINWLSSLKLRGGFGQTGNQDAIGPYLAQFLFGPNNNLFYDGASASFLPSNFATQNPNPNLRWEVNTQVDFAIDFGLFNNRLTGSLDVYNRRTDHLLYTYTVATGGQFFVPYITANIGSLNNKGLELSLNYKAIAQKDFSWTIAGNIGFNRNKIVNLSGTLDNTNFNVTQANIGTVSGLGISGAISNVGYLKVGMPVGTLLLPEYAGQSPKGAQEFYYKNSKGQRDTTSNVSLLNYADNGTGDRQFYTTDPKFTYGISNTFNYQKFDLNIFLRGQYGSHGFNETYMDYTSLTKVGTYSILADATKYNITSSSEPSSFWLESTSFLKIQSITLGYNISFPNSRYVDKLHLYVAGNNLYTFTPYKGGDPELTTTGGESGIETRYTLYPRTRQLSFGLNLNLK